MACLKKRSSSKPSITVPPNLGGQSKPPVSSNETPINTAASGNVSTTLAQPNSSDNQGKSMSLATFFEKVDNDVAKVAPLVDTALSLVAAISPGVSSTVVVVEGVLKAAASAGLPLENDVESLWADIQSAVTSLATSAHAANAAAAPAPAAG
jgi:hypothetical protein